MGANTITPVESYDVAGNALSYSSYTFQAIHGPVGLAEYELKEIDEQPGVFGVAYMLTGFKGDEFDIVTYTGCANTTTLANAKMDYKQLVGSLVTVTDAFNTSWNVLLVMGVQVLEERTVTRGVGTMAGYTQLLTCRWRMRPTATYY